MKGSKANYWDYIRVEDLLGLQSGIDSSEQDLTDDEVRFIVIHQIDELWFKLIDRLTDLAISSLRSQIDAGVAAVQVVAQ